jgi:hypothetical protein
VDADTSTRIDLQGSFDAVPTADGVITAFTSTGESQDVCEMLT